MMAAAKNFAADKDHRLCHSCVVVVLTHGTRDTLIGTDEEPVDIHDFFDCFSASKASGLSGKPKIFIIQACRGG